MTDLVARILQQWRTERPDLDTSPIGVFARLTRAARAAERRQAVVFGSHQLDASGFDVLASLTRSGRPHQLSPKELEKVAVITSAAVSQRLNRLEARGLVRRSRCASDGRATDVSLTEAGAEVFNATIPDHLEMEQRMLGGLSAAEREQLARLLSKLEASIEAAEPLS